MVFRSRHNSSEQIAKIIRLLILNSYCPRWRLFVSYRCVQCVVSSTNFSLTFFFMLNAPHTFYWEEYDFELNRDMYSRRITWNPPSFKWAKNHWNGNHCEQYCYLCLYCQPTKTALCYLAIFKADLSIKSSFSGFLICILTFVCNGNNS